MASVNIVYFNFHTKKEIFFKSCVNVVNYADYSMFFFTVVTSTTEVCIVHKIKK